MFFAWMLLGLLSALAASEIEHNTGEGLLIDSLLGIVGAISGGYLFSAYEETVITAFDLHSMLGSVVGALILLGLYRARGASSDNWSPALDSEQDSAE